jgi:hypothetical protein
MDQKLRSFFPYISSLVLIGIPIGSIKEDFWDGVVITYAFKSGNLDGIEEMLTSSGWELQFYLVQLQLLISRELGVSFHSINVASILVSVLLIIYVTQYLAKNLLGLKPPYVLFAGTLIGAMPYWSGTPSSILNIHTVCLALGLIGFKFFLEKHMVPVIFGLFLMVLSFQLNSMLLFLPTILLVTILAKKGNATKFNVLYIKLFILVLASVSYFVLKRKIDPPTGAYTGYNQFQDFSSLNSYKNFLLNTISYSTFLIFPAFTLLLGIITIVIHKKYLVKKSFLRLELKNYLYIILMAISAILPYLMVGKSSDIRNLVGWSYRHTILLSIPLALLIALILASVFERIKENSPKRRISLSTVGIFSYFLMVGLLLVNFAVLQNRSVFLNDLKILLAAEVSTVPKGLVQIVGPGIPTPEFANYEVNYLLDEVYPGLNYWGALTEKVIPDYTVPKFVSKSNKATYLYQFSNKQNSTVIYIEAVGYDLIYGLFPEGLISNDKKRISLVKVVTSIN